MAITYATVVTEVERRLGDSAHKIWNKTGDTSEIFDYLKEGTFQLTIRTQMLWKRDTPAGLDDVANQALYDLPSDLYQIERLLWKQRAIDAVTHADMERLDHRYETETGEVDSYMIEGDGLHKLRKIAVPGVSLAGTTIIEYTQRPATPATAAANFTIPDRFVKYVRFYALWRALDRNGEGQDPVAAAHYKARFDAGVARVNARKERYLMRRRGRMGGGQEPLGRPPKPRLPWNFGKVVR